MLSQQSLHRAVLSFVCSRDPCTLSSMLEEHQRALLLTDLVPHKRNLLLKCRHGWHTFTTNVFNCRCPTTPQHTWLRVQQCYVRMYDIHSHTRALLCYTHNFNCVSPPLLLHREQQGLGPIPENLVPFQSHRAVKIVITSSVFVAGAKHFPAP